MPFVLLILGLLFFIVAVRGTHQDFFSLIKGEFTGSNNFVVWVAAFVILGMIGYIKPVKPIAHALILLLLLVLVLTKGKGFFSQFNSALRNPASINPPAAQPTFTVPTVTPGSQVPGPSQPSQPNIPGIPMMFGP